MITKPPQARLRFLVVLIVGVCGLLSLSACNLPTALSSVGEVAGVAEAGGTAGVTILYPADGDRFQVGDFIDVHSQIGDPSGVVVAILTANGQLLRQDQLVSPVAGGQLYQPWVPDAPGTYLLQVILETGSGGQQISQQVSVIVGEELTPTVTATLTTETPTLIATLEGSPTPTLSSTPETPTVTSTPDRAMATGQQNSNCRKGPDVRYDVQGYLMEGETVPIVGRNADRSWWVVELSNPTLQCWVWGGGVSVSGNTDDLPIIQPPPLPTYTPTLTNTPRPTYTPKPSEPVYNACHDYPDLSTCNSDPNGFGNCTWDTGMNRCQP